MAIRGYYLGCPGWGIKTWVGRLFPSNTKPTEFLARYAEVFNTVEGNTTFYALPTPDIVARWREQTPSTFRFCFKFPKTVTHERRLQHCEAEVREFLDRVSPLGERLGTLFVQLPPSFAPAHMPLLRDFVATLPRELRYGVELRHEDFFVDEIERTHAHELLSELGVDLVMMDARGLHAGKSLAVADVRARKPDLPVVMRATARRPLIRCVPHEDFVQTRPYVDEWVTQVAAWIAEGKTPYFFMHAPDDTFAPENAYAFHALLRARVDVGELPPWPSTPKQLGLF